jgi:hypothetical protein
LTSTRLCPWTSQGGRLGGLHHKAILGCREEGVRHRSVRGSAHGRVEGWPGGGANGGGLGANSGDSVQGPSKACGGASGGARAGYEEEKVDWRVANDGAHDNAYGAPMVAAAAMEPAVPATGLAGALVLIAVKGGPTRGWGCPHDGGGTRGGACGGASS